MFSRKSLTHVSKRVAIGAAVLGAVLAPNFAYAEEVEYLTQFNGNILWTLIAACLVMFHAGRVRLCRGRFHPSQVRR